MKRLIAVFLAAMLVISAVPARAEDDPYYLTNEIRETEFKYTVVHASAEKARNFIAKYGEMTESLKKAYDELDALESKMRGILQKNLIKSTIKLGIDTYGKVNLVLGFAQQSAKLIIVACACEFVGDQMQDSFSTPYSKAVNGLSDEAKKLAPEIEEVQRTLSLSMDEVKAEALKAGDKLGDVGAIYRKFQMVLEAIEKAKRKIYDLRKKLDSTLNDVKGSLPQIEEEEKQLETRIKDLKERLGKLYQAKVNELSQPIVQGAKAREQVSFTPAPMPGLTPEAAREIIDRELSKLYSVVQSGRTELENLNAEYVNAVKQPTYDGGSYNPLEHRTPGMPIFQPIVEKDLKGSDPQSLKAEEEFCKSQIKLNTQLIKTVKEYANRYSALEESIRQKAAPILGVLAGVGGPTNDINLRVLLNSIASMSISLPIMADTLSKEIDILDKNKPMYMQEFNRQAAEAKDFVNEFETECSGTVNAASMVADRANKVIKSSEAKGFANPSDYAKVRNEARAEAGKMLADGVSTSDVRDYLNRKKGPLVEVYEEAAKVPHLVRLRDNTRSAFESKYMSDPRLAMARRFAELYPEMGIKDPSVKYSEQYWQYQTNVHIEELMKVGNIEGNAYFMADSINEFQEFLPKIDDINRRVRELFSGKTYSESARKMVTIVAELNSDSAFLRDWLKTVQLIGEDGKPVRIYMVTSKETRAVMEAAVKKERDQRDAEDAARAQEEKRKQEEERKKREKDDAEQSGYRLYNPRINTMAVPNISGEIVLLSSDLKNDTVELTAGLDNMYGVVKMLASEDGRVFQEIATNRDIRYSFRPVSERRYEPVIKLKMDDGTEKALPFFTQGQILVYRNIDINRLVVEAVKKIADAYEGSNVAAFAEMISMDFLGNKTFLEEGVRFDFDMFSNIRLKIFINRIERRAGMFVCETKWDKTQMVRKTGQQQRTSGQTTFMFVLEDGRMKIKNLRGNLIYATLSPEIAESSGLNQKIVEEIRVAQIARDPVQPGAGQTEESGGVGVQASPINTRSLTITVNSGFTEGVDLSSGTQVLSGTGDFDIEFVDLFFASGSTKLQNVTGSYTYSSLTTAPDVADASPVTGATGTLILVQTNEGYYAKVYVVSAVETVPGATSVVTINFAVQPDGSRNLKTQ